MLKCFVVQDEIPKMTLLSELIKDSYRKIQEVCNARK